MCNAWNHPPDCTCGWGGDGATGGGNNSGVYYFGWSSDIYRWHYISYTNPNAKCPVCNAPVFFYRSPFGGRVFFDDLGPPWPKHPCTDNDINDIPILFRNILPNNPNWEKEGWYPAILVRKGYAANEKLVSFRVFDKRNKRIVLTLMIDEIEKLDEYNTLMFYRNINEEEFEISLYNYENEVEVKFRLYYYGGIWR